MFRCATRARELSDKRGARLCKGLTKTIVWMTEFGRLGNFESSEWFKITKCPRDLATDHWLFYRRINTIARIHIAPSSVCSFHNLNHIIGKKLGTWKGVGVRNKMPCSHHPHTIHKSSHPDQPLVSSRERVASISQTKIADSRHPCQLQCCSLPFPLPGSFISPGAHLRTALPRYGNFACPGYPISSPLHQFRRISIIASCWSEACGSSCKCGIGRRMSHSAEMVSIVNHPMKIGITPISPVLILVLAGFEAAPVRHGPDGLPRI